MSTDDLVSIDGLRVELGGRLILDIDAFSVRAGRILGVVGESGSGKTMLLRTLKTLLPSSATVSWDRAAFEGRPVAGLGGLPAAMVFQDPMTSFDPLMRIGGHLVEVVRRGRRIGRAAARDDALQALAAVRIPDPARVYGSYPHELSGGLRQRAMIAMALLAKPRLLLADEPTTALDATVQAEILALLRRVQAERDLTVVFVTHDLSVVAAVCDDVLVMKDGRVVERGSTDEVFGAPQHPYTRTLLEAIPGAGGAR